MAREKLPKSAKDGFWVMHLPMSATNPMHRSEEEGGNKYSSIRQQCSGEGVLRFDSVNSITIDIKPEWFLPFYSYNREVLLLDSLVTRD